jgi:hypothetical protein
MNTSGDNGHPALLLILVEMPYLTDVGFRTKVYMCGVWEVSINF